MKLYRIVCRRVIIVRREKRSLTSIIAEKESKNEKEASDT